MAEPKGDRPNRRNTRGAPNNGGMRFSRGLFGWFLFGALCIVLFLLPNNNRNPSTTLGLSDVFTELKAGNVSSVRLEGDTIYGTLKTPKRYKQVNVTEFKAETPPNSIPQSLT